MKVKKNIKKKNIVRSLRKVGLKKGDTVFVHLDISTIGLTGLSGKLKSLVNISVEIPSDNVQFIQEAHIVTEHIICMLVEKYLFGE